MNVAIYDNSAKSCNRLNDIITAALLMKDIEVNVLEYQSIMDLLHEIAYGRPLDFIIYSQIDSVSEEDSTLELIKEKSVCLKLTKPFTIKDVISLIKIAINLPEKTKYLIVNNRRIDVLNLSDILYVESENNKCVIHCKGNKVFAQYKQLDEIEKEISAPNFLRPHKSFLVNMDYIVSADKNFVLTNGDKVLIRQREIAAMKQKFLEYSKSTAIKA